MIPVQEVPIQEIKLENTNVRLFIKREDLIHPIVSGNKFWKLKLAMLQYLELDIPNEEKCIITFGGAFSNHITATAFTCEKCNIKSIGIIRGDELAKTSSLNPSLQFAKENGMELHFVSREMYRDKHTLENQFKEKYPNALIIPEGGSNALAVQGIKDMLYHTEDFDYLCTAIGTGGTFAGIAKFAQNHQKCIGVMVVEDAEVLPNIIEWSGTSDFEIINYKNSRYGQLNEEEVRFMNAFYKQHHIALDPIYTVKLLKTIIERIENNAFPDASKILCIHTGGRQALAGMNAKLAQQNRELIAYI